MKTSRRLKIAHVTLGLDMGGQEKLLVEFARNADRSRFDLHFIVLGRRGVLAADIEKCGWTIETLEVPDGLHPGLVLRLRKLFRNGQFDVVHTHDDKPLIYGAPAGRLAGVPFVTHTHHHGKVAQISRRQALLVGIASRFVHRFICVSEDSARYVIGAGVPASKTSVIHNGIDLSRFSCVGPNPTGPAITVARLSPAKGIHILLRAAAHVLRAAPDFRLQIAGQGPCFTELQQEAREWGLEKTVEFLGEVNDIPSLLAEGRMFILPSFSEGISLTLLEAMARGLPVLATRVGGVPELVVENETGMLVPAHDAEALARGITAMWNDPALGLQWGAAGRQRVEESFDVQRMVGRYEDLYLESVAEKAGSLQPCTL